MSRKEHNTRIKKIGFLLAFFLSSISYPSFSLQKLWNVTKFGAQEGVPQNYVRAILEAQDGTVWIGTWGEGVWRIRGEEWSAHNMNMGIKDDSVRALAIDQHARIWAGTSTGLNCFYKGEWYHFERGNEFDDSIFCVESTQDGTIWVGTEGRIFVYHPGEPFNESTVSQKLVLDHPISKGKTIYSIKQTMDGVIWATVQEIGLLSFDGEYWKRYHKENQDFSSATQLTIDSQDRLWVQCKESLYLLDSDEWKRFNIPKVSIQCFEVTRDGIVFLGTDNGMWVHQNSKWHFFNPEGKIGHIFIGEILETSDGALLLGTKQGLIRVNPSSWTIFDSSNDSDLFPVALHATPHYLPIGVDYFGRLLEYNDQRWAIKNDSLSLRQVLQINHDKNGDIWILTNHDLYKLSGRDYSLLKHIPLPDDFNPVTMLHISNDKHLLCTLNGIYEINQTDQFHILYSLQKNVLNVSTLDSKNCLWIGLTFGVQFFKNFNFIPLNVTNVEVTSKKILTICPTLDGQIWFGSSSDGIFVYHNDKWSRFTTQNGPLSSRINTLYQATDQTIWSGEIESRISNFRNDRWINYTRKDGLIPGEVKYIGEHPEGTIWFYFDDPKGDGIMRYHPMPGNPDTRITAAPNQINPGGIGVFSFTGYDYWNVTSLSDLVFSWRIIDAAQQNEIVPWTPYSSDTTVTSSNLPAGKYIFEVRSADRHRHVDLSPASTPFTVLVPFWARPGFFVPIIFLSIIIMTLIALVYKHQNALMTSERNLRAMLENTFDLIGVMKPDGTLTRINHTFIKRLGVDINAVHGHPLWMLSGFTDGEHEKLKDAIQKAANGEVARYEAKYINNKGNELCFDFSIKPIRNDKAQIVSLISEGRDITVRKRMENRIKRMAYFDTLTGLPNRKMFHDRLKQAVIHSARENTFLAVLFSDLDFLILMVLSKLMINMVIMLEIFY